MTRSRSFALRSLGVAVVVVALTGRGSLEAQPDAERARTATLDELLPMSGAVTTGTLDNGLKYFIRANSEPESRAFLRLVVDVGSVVEEADEQGVAHFLEHMAFNGTENFEKGELVERLESIGMRIGTGLNARTSFDETVYMLSVPTDAPEHIETAMQILEDWAAAITFDQEEIELERGVVLEEWRASQGAGSRVREQHLPVLFAGSRYAERLPIGTAESIAAIDRETLLGFYRKWYRPDLMAVVAVGDFDVARIEGLIRRHFSGLEPQLGEAPERPIYGVPGRAETAYSIATDPELPAATVDVVHLREPPDNDLTVGDARRRLVEQLYNGLLSARFQELARAADAPFVSAFSQVTRPIRPTLSYSLQAAVLQNELDRGLSALVAELERVQRFGFTATELERGKTQLLRSMESRYASRDSRPSTMFAERYTQAFLMQRPVPSIELERALVERFVPEITLEEVNAVGRGWIDGASRVVLVTAPAKEGLAVPDEAALAAAIGAAAEAELAPYVDRGAGETLLDAPPVGSAVVAERARDAGITEWELANGVRVVLKPTDFNQDQIVFRGVFAGGVSLAEDAELVAAQTAVPVIASSGLGDHDVTALQKMLTGKAAAANAFVTEYETGVAGQASPKDLQTLFELIYLRFTAPRADANAFATVQNQMRLGLANRDSNPAVAFNDAFNRLLTQGHPRARPLTVASLDEMSLERSHAFYRDRFSRFRPQTNPALHPPLMRRQSRGG